MEKIIELLEKILEIMQISAKVEKKEEKEITILDIQGEDLGRIIGKDGKTLDALQFLLNIIINKGNETKKKITLDADGYRAKKERKIRDLAFEVAKEVKIHKKEVILQPMSSYERRIIHLTLQDDEEIFTESRGEGKERRLVVLPRRK